MDKSTFARLSARERQVVCGALRGQRYKETANDLGISVKTVDTYKANAFKTLGVTNLVALTLLALRSGVIDVDGNLVTILND